jgi:hypothetical protein
MRTLAAVLLLISTCWAAGPEKSDLAIAEDIRARFAKSKISSNNFQVKVTRRVATLTGRTDVVQHKATATRLAKSAGATTVINNIEVSSTAREKSAARLKKAREAANASKQDKENKDTPHGPSGIAESPRPGPGTVPPPVRRAEVKH